MISPVNHARTPEDAAVYKAEPYVIVADVYAVAPHIGRGGWSWYTGSAGWMYRLIVESLLGVTLEKDRLRLAPRLPADWTGFTMHYRHGATTYEIVVRQRDAAPGERIGTPQVTLDGAAQAGSSIPLVDDRREHRVLVDVAADAAAHAADPQLATQPR